METFLIRALQLIMNLSLPVIIHEGGYFLFAHLFKTRVEKFCLFFDPWLILFKFKPKNSETEYGIGWLPLGGYVKIVGMMDGSMDIEQMKQPVQPWEFRAKLAWQRLLIMVGGVLFDFILALFTYSMILFTWSSEYVPLQKVTLGMDFNEAAKAVGFRDDDILVSADGVPLERYNSDMLTSIVDARQVAILRNRSEASIYIPEDMMECLLADSVRFASFRTPFMIDSIPAGTPASLAGLLPGDNITHMDGKAISYSDFEGDEVRRKQNNASHDLYLTYIRNGVTDTLTLTSDSLYNIEVYPTMQTSRLLPIVKEECNFFASIPAGISLGVSTLKGYVSQMKYLFSREGVKQLGGFGTIGSIFPAMWDWRQFWYVTAFLSIILAFMNILPIPALDGGHVLFLIYEIVARRKPSDKFIEHTQMVGMFPLFGLLIWTNFNDILRFFF